MSNNNSNNPSVATQEEIAQAIEKAVKESNHPLSERYYCPFCHSGQLYGWRTVFLLPSHNFDKNI